MDGDQILLVVLGAIVVTAFARRQSLQPALVITVVGLAASFIPGLERLEPEPEIILSLIVPPLIYSTAVNVSFTSFARLLAPILRLGMWWGGSCATSSPPSGGGWPTSATPGDWMTRPCASTCRGWISRRRRSCPARAPACSADRRLGRGARRSTVVGVSNRVRGAVLRLQETAPQGLLEDWSRTRGIALDVIAIEDGPLPPLDPATHAFAVVLGSAGSLAQDLPPWADDVLSWLRAADVAAVPVLGICFGAQALAAALGGSVHRLASPEIGWVEVDTQDAERVPSGPWIAWHEDGLRMPPPARELARNAFGTQAFGLRRHLGVQFHPEATQAIVEGWATSPHSRLAETGATIEDLRAASAEHGAAAVLRAERLFDGFAARAGIAPTVAAKRS